jgi:hypothetical protein
MTIKYTSTDKLHRGRYSTERQRQQRQRRYGSINSRTPWVTIRIRMRGRAGCGGVGPELFQ